MVSRGRRSVCRTKSKMIRGAPYLGERRARSTHSCGVRTRHRSAADTCRHKDAWLLRTSGGGNAGNGASQRRVHHDPPRLIFRSVSIYAHTPIPKLFKVLAGRCPGAEQCADPRRHGPKSIRTNERKAGLNDVREGIGDGERVRAAIDGEGKDESGQEGSICHVWDCEGVLRGSWVSVSWQWQPPQPFLTNGMEPLSCEKDERCPEWSPPREPSEPRWDRPSRLAEGWYLVGDVPSSAEASLEKTSAGKKSRSTSNESDVHGPPTKGYADLTKKSVHKWSQPST
eukprot:scaffold197683_cov31-Tisochrysis_lutea.AAC.8